MARETESEEAALPPMLSKEEETEAAFWRLKRASDEWREDRVKRVLAQEGESPLRTLGRVLYVSACVLFDGLILTEIPVRMGKTTFSWLLIDRPAGPDNQVPEGLLRDMVRCRHRQD